MSLIFGLIRPLRRSLSIGCDRLLIRFTAEIAEHQNQRGYADNDGQQRVHAKTCGHSADQNGHYCGNHCVGHLSSNVFYMIAAACH